MRKARAQSQRREASHCAPRHLQFSTRTCKAIDQARKIVPVERWSTIYVVLMSYASLVCRTVGGRATPESGERGWRQVAGLSQQDVLAVLLDLRFCEGVQ